MRKTGLIITVILVTLALAGCKQRGKSSEQAAPEHFPMIQIPAMIADGAQAAEYLALHYWDEFMDTGKTHPVADTLVQGITLPSLEQAFANYVAILGNVPYPTARESVSGLYDKMVACEKADTASRVFESLTEIVERYLYDPNSPLRNEDLYQPFAQKMSGCDLIPEIKRSVYQRDARLCSLNMVGTPAADFVFCDKNGRKHTLYGIKAEYTLLFFTNPGCQACKEIIDVLIQDPYISSLVSTGRLAVVNIYIDEDLREWRDYMPIYPEQWYNGYDPDLIIRDDLIYNVRAIPSLYLLDASKTVLMKDAPQENVFAVLSQL